MMKQVDIFVSGSCAGNPGPGTWRAILRMGPHEKCLSGSDASTTQNRMELTAAISALHALIEACEVSMHTSSRSIVGGVEKWMDGWTRKGWVNTSRRPVRNSDLWHELIAHVRVHELGWVLVEQENPAIERAKRLSGA